MIHFSTKLSNVSSKIFFYDAVDLICFFVGIYVTSESLLNFYYRIIFQSFQIVEMNQSVKITARVDYITPTCDGSKLQHVLTGIDCNSIRKSPFTFLLLYT